MNAKIKTAELTGPALDWAVAKCELPDGWPEIVLGDETDYSTSWAQGGPIIEAVGMTLMYCEGEYIAGTNPECFDNQVFMYHKQYGPTHLIAAMRCYVASKLGDEVEIPEELT
jgi:hypothetical protein